MSRGAVATWGKIDVLFSNAGNDGPIVPTIEYPEEIFNSIIATHVRGCFLGCKYVIPQMNDGGSIVITSSITGVKGVAGNCSYVAAKHALMGLIAPHRQGSRETRNSVSIPSIPVRSTMNSCARPKGT